MCLVRGVVLASWLVILSVDLNADLKKGVGKATTGEVPRQVVAKVYKAPVYLDELGKGSRQQQADRLRHLIILPLLDDIRRANQSEIEPTPGELLEATGFFNRLGIKEAEAFANWFLPRWKTQRFLYHGYGGGRVLWQQAGHEAFDAMYNWLRQEEAVGHFGFKDAQWRKDFYFYWDGMGHGAFLTSDQQRIREDLLEPGWAPVSKNKDSRAHN